ncbi:MAG: xanthine dehydrogenase family protein subunit M [Burkholderiales bacterium]|nr:xanthine dehydrogenase family protein subunit M [Burkholderiales bacterium]
MTADTYLAPKRLDEALEALRGGEATILAGGTDLMVQSQSGKTPIGPKLVNIRRIAGLAGVVRADGEIHIGALTTIAELLEHELVRTHLPSLAEACDHFASSQIRNAGTLGGNVCNASPAGDTLVPLLALGASVELAAKPDAAVTTRAMPLGEFIVGPGKTQRKPAELLTAIRIPVPAAGGVQRFFKFGTRPALDIAAISLGLVTVKEGGVLRHVRLALGAVAPVPMRGVRAESMLEGRRLDPALIEAAAAAARDEVRPISDVRASDWYRRELVRNMVKRMLTDVSQS